MGISFKGIIERKILAQNVLGRSCPKGSGILCGIVYVVAKSLFLTISEYSFLGDTNRKSWLQILLEMFLEAVRKTTIYCLGGCCLIFVAIGLVTTSSEKAAPEPQGSKFDPISNRRLIRPAPPTIDEKDETNYSWRGINSHPDHAGEVANVHESREVTGVVKTELKEEISLLTQSDVEGAELLPNLLERALSTPDNSLDDLEFMTTYHKVRTATPAKTQNTEFSH